MVYSRVKVLLKRLFSKPQTYKWLAIFVVLLVAAYFVRDILDGCTPRPPLVLPGDEYVASVEAENTSLRRLLNETEDHDRELYAILSNLKPEQIEKIREVVKIEYVLQGNTTTTTVLPPSHTFLSGEIPVAEFLSKDMNYTFTSADLDFSVTTILFKDQTEARVTVGSSLSPGKRYPVKISHLIDERLPTHKILEPHIGLGFTYSIPRFESAASLAVSVYHPKTYLDVGVARVLIGDSLWLGLDPVAYNVGDKLPVFTDLWVSAGVSSSPLTFTPSADLTVSTKF